jgi:hypothetical protein
MPKFTVTRTITRTYTQVIDAPEEADALHACAGASIDLGGDTYTVDKAPDEAEPDLVIRFCPDCQNELTDRGTDDPKNPTYCDYCDREVREP